MGQHLFLLKGGVIILRKTAWIIIGMVLVMFAVTTSYAREIPAFADATVSETDNGLLEVEAEYLSPMHSSRRLQTESISALKNFWTSESGNFTYYGGLTLTHAWGVINRNHLEYDCSANGIGPAFLVRYQPWQGERWSLACDFSGAFILYNEDFPAGGDMYNFMWRFGPKLTYKISERSSINFGYKFMHVSNGQRDHNPAYDSRGPSLGVAFTF